ncbi:MAG: hypothetical protein QGI77_14780 [Roseibacillus sp.]|nr:hypothetical protein [Roseibacillus sp.]
MRLLLRCSFLALLLYRESDPLLDQIPQASVIGDLPLDAIQLVRTNEPGAVPASGGITQIVIRPVLLRVLRLLARAAGGPADVVLFAQAARMQTPQLAQLLLDRFNPPVDLFLIYADSLLHLSGTRNKKENFFFHPPSPATL